MSIILSIIQFVKTESYPWFKSWTHIHIWYVYFLPAKTTPKNEDSPSCGVSHDQSTIKYVAPSLNSMYSIGSDNSQNLEGHLIQTPALKLIKVGPLSNWIKGAGCCCYCTEASYPSQHVSAQILLRNSWLLSEPCNRESAVERWCWRVLSLCGFAILDLDLVHTPVQYHALTIIVLMKIHLYLADIDDTGVCDEAHLKQIGQLSNSW